MSENETDNGGISFTDSSNDICYKFILYDNMFFYVYYEE